MGEIYYIKVKVLSLIIYFSGNGYISKSKKGDFLVFVFLRISSLGEMSLIDSSKSLLLIKNW